MVCASASGEPPTLGWRGFWRGLGLVLWAGLQEFCGKKAFREIDGIPPRQEGDRRPPFMSDAPASPFLHPLVIVLRTTDRSGDGCDAAQLIDEGCVFVQCHDACLGHFVPNINRDDNGHDMRPVGDNPSPMGRPFKINTKNPHWKAGARHRLTRLLLFPNHLELPAFLRNGLGFNAADFQKWYETVKKYESGERELGHEWIRIFRQNTSADGAWLVDGNENNIRGDLIGLLAQAKNGDYSLLEPKTRTSVARIMEELRPYINTPDWPKRD